MQNYKFANFERCPVTAEMWTGNVQHPYTEPLWFALSRDKYIYHRKCSCGTWSTQTDYGRRNIDCTASRASYIHHRFSAVQPFSQVYALPTTSRQTFSCDRQASSPTLCPGAAPPHVQIRCTYSCVRCMWATASMTDAMVKAYMTKRGKSHRLDCS